MAKANSIIALVFLALTFIFSIITIAMVGKGYQDIKDLEHVINYMDILNLKDANIKGSAAGVLVVAIISSVVSLVAFILTLISTSKSSPTASGKPKIWGIVLLVTSLLWIISMLAFSIIAGTKRFQVGQGKNYDSLLTGSGGSTMTGSTSLLRSAIVIGSRSSLGDSELEKRELEITELLERYITPVQKRADDDDEDNDDDSDSSSDSTSTTSSASTTDDGFGSSITDSGIYNSGGGVSNMYGANMPKYIKVRSSKRIIGLGWVAFAFTTITGFLLLLLPLKNQSIAHETGTTASPEMATREVSKEPEEV